jgi:hypothetical protein
LLSALCNHDVLQCKQVVFSSFVCSVRPT